MPKSILQQYLESSEAPKTQLYIGKTPLKSDSQLYQPTLILHPAFSNINYKVIEILSETGYGEFSVTIEKKNNDYLVCIKGHLSERYFLNEQESKVIYKAYQQIYKASSTWYLSKFDD